MNRTDNWSGEVAGVPLLGDAPWAHHECINEANEWHVSRRRDGKSRISLGLGLSTATVHSAGADVTGREVFRVLEDVTASTRHVAHNEKP